MATLIISDDLLHTNGGEARLPVYMICYACTGLPFVFCGLYKCAYIIMSDSVLHHHAAIHWYLFRLLSVFIQGP